MNTGMKYVKKPMIVIFDFKFFQKRQGENLFKNLDDLAHTSFNQEFTTGC